MKGDFNGDKIINLTDVNYLLNNIAGKEGFSVSLFDGDLNGDGDIGLADVNYLLKYISNNPNYDINTSEKIGTIYVAGCQIPELPLFSYKMEELNKYDIDYYIHLGDNIYADILVNEDNSLYWYYSYGNISPNNFKQILQTKYNYLKNVYDTYLPKNWLEKCIMTWDDHDYGFNDRFREINDVFKNITFNEYCKFWNIPENDPRRNINRGVYHSKVINFDIFKIRVIMLDQTSQSNYNEVPQSEFDSLGEEQWNFLENEINTFNNNLEDLVIIGTPKQTYWEQWQGFNKTTLKRFLDLLKKINKNQVLILSGDAHANSINKIPNGENQFVYEIQSGGRTNTRAPNILNEDYFIGTVGVIPFYTILNILKNKENKMEIEIKFISSRDHKSKFNYYIK